MSIAAEAGLSAVTLSLDELADLVVGLAQILGDLADHILVDLDDLAARSSVCCHWPAHCEAMYCARSPGSRAASALQRGQAVICTRCCS